MKRIKLFEAFSNSNKIEKANIIFFKWIIIGYINFNHFNIEKDPLNNSFNIGKIGYRQFSYFPDDNFSTIKSMEDLYPILNKYKVKSAFGLANWIDYEGITIFKIS